MSGEKSDSEEASTHPARKIHPDELMEVLAETMQDVPSPTKRIIALKFPEVVPETVGNNLDKLADGDKICRHNDGDVALYWIPREGEEGGEVSLQDVLDDSLDYDKIDPEEVSFELAEEIAEAKIPFYSPPSFWLELSDIALRGLILSMALVFAGFGGLVVGSYGLGEQAAVALIEYSTYFALFTTVVYVLTLIAHFFAIRGKITRNPLPGVIQHLPLRSRQ